MLQYIKEFDLQNFWGPTNIEDMPVLYGYLPLNFFFFSSKGIWTISAAA